MGKKLDRSYYLNEDVVFLARDLIGKVLCTRIKGKYTSGVISETEAYAGATDRASHAFGNRRTNRTEIMYQRGGLSYVYLCYGIHKLFNVVTGPVDMPHAVLVRGVKPLDGIELMEKRRKKRVSDNGFSSGPGTLTVALGIDMDHNKKDLRGDIVWIEDRKIEVPPAGIEISPRIGIDYAKEDKDLPYRFLWP